VVHKISLETTGSFGEDLKFMNPGTGECGQPNLCAVVGVDEGVNGLYLSAVNNC